MYAARDKNFNPELVYFFNNEPTPDKNGDFVNDCSMFRMEYDDLKKTGIILKTGQCKPVIMAVPVGEVVEVEAKQFSLRSGAIPMATVIWDGNEGNDNKLILVGNPFGTETNSIVKIFCEEQRHEA